MVDRVRTMKIHQQAGLSLIGFVLVLCVVLFISFVGMKIGPVYLEYYSVASAMDGLASETGSAKLSPYEIRRKFFTRLDVNAVESVRASNIKLSKGNGVHLRVTYEVRKPVVGNLDMVAKFDKSVQLAN